MWTPIWPFGKCFYLLVWVAIIAVFHSSCTVCNMDILQNTLSRAKRWPALVSP